MISASESVLRVRHRCVPFRWLIVFGARRFDGQVDVLAALYILSYWHIHIICRCCTQMVSSMQCCQAITSWALTASVYSFLGLITLATDSHLKSSIKRTGLDLWSWFWHTLHNCIDIRHSIHQRQGAWLIYLADLCHDFMTGRWVVISCGSMSLRRVPTSDVKAGSLQSSSSL